MKELGTLHRALVWGLASLGAMPGGLLRADELASFQELQTKYQTFLKETARPLYDGYARKLLEMERAAVTQRNYALAAKIKTERLNAGKELGISLTEMGGATLAASTGVLELDGSVTMSAPSATLGGSVTMDAEKAALTGWSSTQCFARWKLPTGLKTGGYEVELTYSCAAGGGSFIVKEDQYSLKREAKDSGSWASFRPEICGTLRVKASSQNLQISAASVLGEGLFYLKMVRLLPCHDTSGS
jgi:hypothetical protein